MLYLQHRKSRLWVLVHVSFLDNFGDLWRSLEDLSFLNFGSGQCWKVEKGVRNLTI